MTPTFLHPFFYSLPFLFVMLFQRCVLAQTSPAEGTKVATMTAQRAELSLCVTLIVHLRTFMTCAIKPLDIKDTYGSQHQTSMVHRTRDSEYVYQFVCEAKLEVVIQH